MEQYYVLNYPGDVTACDQAQPFYVLGTNVEGFPLYVIQAEYNQKADRTVVDLAVATPDILRLLAEQQKAKEATV